MFRPIGVVSQAWLQDWQQRLTSKVEDHAAAVLTVGVQDTTAIKDTSLRMLSELFTTFDVSVVAIAREGKTLTPDWDTAFQTGDVVTMLVRQRDVTRIRSLFNGEDEVTLMLVDAAAISALRSVAQIAT